MDSNLYFVSLISFVLQFLELSKPRTLSRTDYISDDIKHTQFCKNYAAFRGKHLNANTSHTAETSAARFSVAFQFLICNLLPSVNCAFNGSAKKSAVHFLCVTTSFKWWIQIASRILQLIRFRFEFYLYEPKAKYKMCAVIF